MVLYLFNELHDHQLWAWLIVGFFTLVGLIAVMDGSLDGAFVVGAFTVVGALLMLFAFAHGATLGTDPKVTDLNVFLGFLWLPELTGEYHFILFLLRKGRGLISRLRS
jgi:hypothetical protein